MMQMNIERMINATGSLLIWLVMILAAVILAGLIVIAVKAIGRGVKDIADIQNCGKNTPSRWSKELIRKMSVKLFGIDGVEKY